MELLSRSASSHLNVASLRLFQEEQKKAENDHVTPLLRSGLTSVMNGVLALASASGTYFKMSLKKHTI